MIEVIKSRTFDTWLRRLKDRAAARRINARIDRLAHGNPGDVKPVGEGVSEMRLAYGPGYRVYYLQQGEALVVLLCGGDKATQSRDIKRAKAIARQWMESAMSEQFSVYDSADYIESDQDAIEYLMACMEDGGDDPAFLAHALGVVARARNMSAMARQVGMSRAGLYKALDGNGNPTLATVVGVLRVLGLRLAVVPKDADRTA
jgi:putative addiction module killer protein/probable addiction module antidote protein